MKTIFYSIAFWVFVCQATSVLGNNLPPFPCDSLGLVDPTSYLDFTDTTYENCLRKAIEIKNPAYKKDSYGCLRDLMVIHTYRSEFEKALVVSEEVMNAATNLDDSISVYSLNSFIYRQSQQLSKAKNEIYTALDIAKKRNSKSAMATIYYESSTIHDLLEDSIQSIKNINLAYDLLPFVVDLGMKALILYQKAKIMDTYGVASNEGDIPLLIKESKKFFKLNNDYFNQGACNGLLAFYYIDNNMFSSYPQAENLLLENITLYKKNNAILGEIEAYEALSFLYTKQNKNELAIKYYKIALPKALEIENYYVYSNINFYLSELYEKKSNYEEAFKHYKDYKAAEDTIAQRQERDVYFELEAKYKNKEQAQSLDLLGQENTINQQQRNLFLGFAIALLGLAGLLFFVLRQKNRLNKIISQQYDQVKELNIFKSKLFAIIGHDLRGLLSKLNFSQHKITNAIQNNKQEKLELMNLRTGTEIEKLNGLVENLLYWGMQQSESISINKELVLLQQVAQQVVYNIQNDLAQKEIEVAFSIPDKFDLATDIDILKLSLRNLLSNAIKFSNKGSIIEIIAMKEQEETIIQIKDYGVGIPSEKISSLFEVDGHKIRTGTQGETGTGLGLWICKGMLQKVGASIQVNSIVNKETLFTLKFPKAA